ncbi:copper homeostasis protein CutC [Brucella endophytica]|uniref:PF03932 family protein CutC n=1 Tax=Brucella endophytica TaxID=1963359 RepID=A0A916WCU1_9HYPH|nr:copper homeostasis protein CutC [Brucella endophytica]GGA86390.1 copper homeostasis protein CutC [Brucella endophytica]
MSVKLEVCVDSPEGLRAAIAGAADRIELCSALDVGGLTPSPGLMTLAAKAPIPVYAMIRPRAGSFYFSAEEEAAMIADIDAVQSAALAGVVIGASLPDGNLDLGLLRRLIAHAHGLGTTLHRVFDLAPDPEKALQEAIELGFERILTSGQANTALEGLAVLKNLSRQAQGRISIMPGSGVTAGNAAQIARETSASEVHASCRETIEATDERSIAFGFSATETKITSATRVREIKQKLGGLTESTASQV